MWFEDQEILRGLATDPRRQDWEKIAANQYDALTWPKPYQDLSRIGTFRIAPLPHSPEDLSCWMYPLDLGKLRGVLVGSKNEVHLFDREGASLFQGRWSECPHACVRDHAEFFIWLAPPQRNEQGNSSTKSWKVRKGLLGRFFSLLRR